ncbi:MAG: hypothetical protein L0Z53_02180 [Acidobacteriales bacterium]|nr:hypothetical protein [Terriglobales bacterium]
MPYYGPLNNARGAKGLGVPPAGAPGAALSADIAASQSPRLYGSNSFPGAALPASIAPPRSPRLDAQTSLPGGVAAFPGNPAQSFIDVPSQRLQRPNPVDDRRRLLAAALGRRQ